MQPDEAVQPDKIALVENGFHKVEDTATLTIGELQCHPILILSNQLQRQLLTKIIWH